MNQNKKLMGYFISSVALVVSAVFIVNSLLSQSTDISRYQHLVVKLKKFECSERKGGERYYYYVGSGERYWSYVNRVDWPTCEEARGIFEPMLNHDVELWLKEYQAVQLRVSGETVFSLENYVGGHRRNGIQHGVFFMILALFGFVYAFKFA